MPFSSPVSLHPFFIYLISWDIHPYLYFKQEELRRYIDTQLLPSTASVSIIQSQWMSAGSRSLLGVALLYVVHPNFWAGLFYTATALHPDGSLIFKRR
jgi:hypothetical protein